MRPARLLPALLAALLATLLVAGPPAAADDTPDPNDNVALAVNTEDGGSVFRLAFAVRMAADGVVDEDNHAWALASCSDCQTVALAFQVVLVWNDPDVVVPHNQAVGYNDGCVECLTYASATQIVLGFDGPVRFTGEGRRRLTELQRALAELEGRIGGMSAAELAAAVTAAKEELVSILSDELVEVPARANAPQATTTTFPAQPTSASTGTTSDDGTTSSTAGTGEAPATTTAPAGSTTTLPTTGATTTTAATTTTTGVAATTTTTAAATTTTTAAETPTTVAP